MMTEELFAPLFYTRRGQQFGWLVLIVASFLLLYTLVTMFFTWRADSIIAHKQSVLGVQTEGETTTAALIAELPAQHIFGLAANDDTGFLPITSLQLHLTGIVKDSENKASKAIISEAGQPGNSYAVGDELTSGIKIYSINEDGIVLEHNGRLEKLPLARTRLQFQEKPKALWPDN